LYRNSTTHELYNLAIPGCDAVCPLEKFVELLQPVIPVNWEKECKMGIFPDDFTLSSLAVIGQYLHHMLQTAVHELSFLCISAEGCGSSHDISIRQYNTIQYETHYLYSSKSIT
jgi:hypothetical protein